MSVVSAGLLWAAAVPRPALGQTNSAKAADAVLLTVEGTVEYALPGPEVWQPAQTNQGLANGTRVRTDIESRATIRLSNQSIVRMNELSSLTIQSPGGGKSGLDVQGGSTYLNSRERPMNVKIRTPLASGAIRGTEFHLKVGPNGQTVLTLIDGEVDLTNDLGQVTLKTGDEGVVEPNQPPRKSPMLDATNIIQWALYYPGVLDVGEVSFNAAESTALAPSLAAYRQGDLLQAVAAWPGKRPANSDAEKIYHAALMLAAGQVGKAEQDLQALAVPSLLANALRQVIATVKGQDWTSPATPTTATEWLAESYYLQGKGLLASALKAAQMAAAKSPEFGFAHARVAELEFSFGRTEAALKALDTGLKLSPRNAQAVALQGFLQAARNDIKQAEMYFEQAIAIDGALGNAWLGRGLCRIKRGDGEAGRQDLQVAATLEPNRAILRSYLGKAWSHTRKLSLADKELSLARRLDPNDPTAWLYSALLDQQQNRINAGVRNLEKSIELNENRKIYRSQLLLDQDRAVRSANLAAIYQDAGMKEVAVREAGKAVNADYANHSAHLFLANSYDALRDPKSVNLRYETPWLSELLVANLLAPAGAGSLSRYVSQQEYSRMFDRDRVGFSSSTEYDSGGNWYERASQYGSFGNSSYALDFEYRNDHGQRLNADLESLYYSLKLKHQFSADDGVFFQADMLDDKSGDLLQYYNNVSPRPRQRVHNELEPVIYAGYNHRWAPGVHTLVLASFAQNDFTLTDPDNTILSFNRTAAGVPTAAPVNRLFPLQFQSDLTAYSLEAQQLIQGARSYTVFGVRYQHGDLDNQAYYTRGFGGFVGAAFPLERTDTVGLHLDRVSGYLYHSWQVLDALQVAGGLSLDYLSYPLNSEVAPLSPGNTSKFQASPKIGMTWTPFKDTALRGAFTRSLGGVFFDNSIRLEPTQLAGFNQAFRSLIPDSITGLVPGTEFQTISLALDQRLKTGTYLTLGGEILSSQADRYFGTYDRYTGSVLASAVTERQRLEYEEKSLLIGVNQLLDENFSLGVTYRLSDARLFTTLPNVPAAFAGATLNEALMHELRPYVLFNHRCGFFSQFEAAWFKQANLGYAPDIPGDDFWQLNVYAGYRFPRRKAEIRVGLLNLTDRNYALNPLNLYQEFPRERTLALSLKLNF